jgi:hypothetical protein
VAQIRAPPGIAAAHGADYYDKRFESVSIPRQQFLVHDRPSGQRYRSGAVMYQPAQDFDPSGAAAQGPEGKLTEQRCQAEHL